jgi:hypothetical protein
MSDEAPFAVTAALVRHFHREAHSPLGIALTQLSRSDRDRLQFFDGSRIVRDAVVERKYVDGESERVVIEAALSDPTLRACLGYVSIAGRCPEEFAWLLDADDGIVDPAWSQHRHLTIDGFYGVALRATETANWLPGDHQRHVVSERESGRQRLIA